MTQEKLNLFYFSASGMTEPRTRASKIMRREFCNSNLSSVLPDNVPDYLLCHFVAPNRAGSANAPEHPANSDASRHQPFIDCPSDPVRYWNCPNVASLTNKIDNGPMIFAPLEMVNRRFRQLTAAESTTQ